MGLSPDQRPTEGSLFSGYDGLGIAVREVYGATLAWYADVCKVDKDGNVGHYTPHRGPCRIMAHHHPDLPNLGDVTKVDWHAVPPVDILTGGSPCQDLSHAGRRAGMTEGTRSNLWAEMREAIAIMRPARVVWENVRGAYSARADSVVESDLGLLGDVRPPRRGDPVLRALGRVLGDLADLGYDASWHGLLVPDGCHPRFRVFLIAKPSDGSGDWLEPLPGLVPLEPITDASRLLPSPRTSDTNGPGAHGDGGVDLRTAVHYLPTPRATDGTNGGPNQRGSSGDLMLPSAAVQLDEDRLLPTPTTQDGANNGGPSQFHRNSLPLNALVTLFDMEPEAPVEEPLLPTPTAMDSHGSGGSTPSNVTLTDATVRTEMGTRPNPRHADLLPTPVTDPDSHNGHARNFGTEGMVTNWGVYAAAIARWTRRIGRTAPDPTQPSKKGNPQLAARFVEWMMGLAAGHVTDVPGITRNEALKALGNGVVPQQAVAAILVMESWW